jgi:exosortase A-associated hydrolase 2
MTAAPAIRETLAFEPFARGQRLRCVSEPAYTAPRGNVLWLPPFAEELNKTRRQCASMARTLAAAGWRVSRFDLYGCGDSSGELRDASWSLWLDDLDVALSKLSVELPGPLWLWGVRAGALFAPHLLRRAPDAGVLLWQPVLSGAGHLQQFLRTHSAAQLIRQGAVHQTSESPAKLLQAGHTVEVAGYELPPAVADGLRAAKWQWPDGATGPLVWIDVLAAADDEVAPATASALSALRGRGIAAHHDRVIGQPFWQTTEVTELQPLTECSVALLNGAMQASAGLVHHHGA